MDIAHAGAIKTALIIIGLATSVPLIVAGSALLMQLLDRYPILVWAGGALLGWVAGDIMIKDSALFYWFPAEVIDAIHHFPLFGDIDDQSRRRSSAACSSLGIS